MDADAEFDASILWHTAVALDEAGLHLDGAAHRRPRAKLDDRAVAGALDDAAAMGAGWRRLCAWDGSRGARVFRPPNVKRDHHEQGAQIAL